MKIRITSACLVRGEHCAKGDVIEVSERDGLAVIESGRAEMVPEERTRLKTKRKKRAARK